jgi:parallel beta-helix repeat protein
MKIKNTFILINIFLLIGTGFSPTIHAEISYEFIRPFYEISSKHFPIYINGNNNFTSENGVTGGSGTEEDPYIIENWIIAGNGSVRDGIFINNTDVYFVIRNCTVFGFNHPDEYYDGIELQFVENGRIENTRVNESHTSIYLRYSNNITISNSTFCDYHKLYGYGISTYYSKYITIKSCECYNLDVGIDLTKSSDIVVDSTNCFDNNKGLDTFAVEPTTMNLVIENSRFYNNKWWGVKLFDRERHPSYSQVINCEFFNNGNKKKESSLIIERLSNNIVENCSFHHNFIGIYTDSKNNVIKNCCAFNNVETGILINGALPLLNFARNNKILNCDVYNNRIGIAFWTSVGSKVEKCNVYNNSWWGLENDMLSIIKINHNNIYNNGYNESFWAPSGLWSMQFSLIDARTNWWGAKDGPKMYRYGHLGIIPIRLKGYEKIIRSRSILLFRPWATEPIPDAGVN